MIDENREHTRKAVDENGDIQDLLVDPITGRLLVDITIVADSGSSVLNTEKIDENKEWVAQGAKSDGTPTPLHMDSRNGYLYVDINIE